MCCFKPLIVLQVRPQYWHLNGADMVTEMTKLGHSRVENWRAFGYKISKSSGKGCRLFGKHANRIVDAVRDQERRTGSGLRIHICLVQFLESGTNIIAGGS